MNRSGLFLKTKIILFTLSLILHRSHPHSSPPRSLAKISGEKEKLKDTLAIKIKDQGGYTVQNQYNANYASMVYALDKNVGRLIDQLEALELLNNTLIIFTSDNGGLTTLEKNIELPPQVFCHFEQEKDGSMRRDQSSLDHQNPT